MEKGKMKVTNSTRGLAKSNLKFFKLPHHLSDTGSWKDEVKGVMLLLILPLAQVQALVTGTEEKHRHKFQVHL